MKTDKRMIIVPDFMIFLKEVEKTPGSTVTQITASTSITYVHIFNIKNSLFEKEWISIQKDGNSNMIHLTEQGQKITDGINYLLQEMCIDEKDINDYRKRTKTKKNKEVEQDEGIHTEGVLPGDTRMEEETQTEDISEANEVTEGNEVEEVKTDEN